MSGTKKVSPPELQSTETPEDLETPKEVTSWADELSDFLPEKSKPQPEPEKSKPQPEQAQAEPRSQVTIISPRDLAVPMVSVVEDGKEVVRPDVIQAVVSLGSLGQLAKIRKALERDHFRGKVDTRELPVTDEYQFIDLVDDWPNTPWVGFFIINHGPNTAKVQINGIYETWLKIRKNETRTIDYSKADERIKRIAYQCDPGETALLEIEGVY